MPSMQFRLGPGGVFLIVHAPVPPSSEDWSAHVTAIERDIATITGLMIVSGGSVPNATQRRQIADMFERVPKRPKVAVVTVSTIERNAITALSWIMRNPIRGFAADRVNEAFAYLETPQSARAELMTIAAQWATGLGNKVTLAA